jgi:hypothetical protein
MAPPLPHPTLSSLPLQSLFPAHSCHRCTTAHTTLSSAERGHARTRRKRRAMHIPALHPPSAVCPSLSKGPPLQLSERRTLWTHQPPPAIPLPTQRSISAIRLTLPCCCRAEMAVGLFFFLARSSDKGGLIRRHGYAELISEAESDAVAYCTAGSSCSKSFPEGFIRAAAVKTAEDNSYIQVMSAQLLAFRPHSSKQLPRSRVA